MNAVDFCFTVTLIQVYGSSLGQNALMPLGLRTVQVIGGRDSALCIAS